MKSVRKSYRKKDTPVRKINSLHTCKKRAFPTAFWKKGSLVIEAALALPVFFFFVVAVVYFLMIIFLQSNIQVSIEEAARSIGKKAYLAEQMDQLTAGSGELDADTTGLLKAGINPLTLKAWILKDGLRQKVNASRIKDGVDGFYTYYSSFDEAEGLLDVIVHYNYHVPFLPGNLGTLQLSQRCRSHIWTGRELSRQEGGKNAEEKETQTVYVTEYGSVYHTSKDCSYLDLSIHAIGISEVDGARNANGGKYYPCTCAQHASSGMVYITDYGTNYHTDLNCSGLKRTIREVALSEVEEMHVCPKCGKEH
ncbi:MAG: pilus assembly protein [Lachnospiraceae bacterium]|nr:pilus assembly protein [Lachnospiraceae bacterium]